MVEDLKAVLGNSLIEFAVYSIPSNQLVFVSERLCSNLVEQERFKSCVDELIKNGSITQLVMKQIGKSWFCVAPSGEDYLVLLSFPYSSMLEALINSAEFNRLFTLGVLVSKVSHEFNNILTGLSGHASYLTELIEDSDLKKSAELIKEGVERAIILTRELVSFSRPASRKETGSVSGFFERLKHWMKIIIPPRIRVETKNLAGTVELETDFVKLNQVFINLVLNAVQAIDGEGSIELVAKKVDSKIEFEISDSGRGMDNSQLENIFKPFVTNKESGTGLGCFICKNLVDELGGEVSVLSKVGIGTKFTIRLPLSNKNRHETELARKEKLEVLLVDDDENVREVLKMGLRYAGFNVVAAENHDSALEIAKSQRLDLAVVDIIMPGKSGLETARELILIQPNLKFIIISGYSPPETIEAFKSMGIKSFLNKPFAIDELTAEILKVIGAK
ncbi:MAG: ATP-binding protein [Deltaproteobacteria bacterium]|nr:ATP-binding protein [Deltaproteobacteria bacterium]